MATQTTTPTKQIFKYDPKFEGIQKDIEVFGDMTLKQINFIAKKLRDIPVIRGCFNVCSHCLLDAKPPIKEDENQINRMAFEDFKALCDGFVELNKRLGCNIFHTDSKHHAYKTLFYDSDCSNVYTVDENGDIHDFIELAGMIHKTTGFLPLFDTASWNPKDKAAQARMEKYAAYYGENFGPINISKFNFSVNPFHSVYTASVEARKSGDIEKAEKYREIYIDRMVNAFFTLTPVIKKRFFSHISRALPDTTKGGEGFRVNDCFLLYIDIFKRLEARYFKVLESGDSRYITSREQIQEIMDKLYSKLRTFYPINFPTGRILRFYPEGDPNLKAPSDYKKNILKNLQNMLSPESKIFGVLDLNGKFYIRTYTETIGTELAFNFKNKDKKTARFGFDMMDFVITNDLLESII